MPPDESADVLDERWPHVISTQDKLREIEREIELRARLYPAWVRLGKLSPQSAIRRIGIMRAIAHDYQAQCNRELREKRDNQ